MLTSFSVCLLAAILGQAPTDAAWLKAIPDDVDVAIRSRGLDATRADVVAMLKAMSPTLAETAEPALTNQLAQLETQFGAIAVRSPWVGVVRIVPGAAGGPPPFAILVLQDDYPGILKAVSGGKEPELKHLADGVDSLSAPQGEGLWYATKGAGFTAVGPDQALITAIAKPKGKTLDKILTPTTAKPFLDGDLGLYVNVAALATRYADQIDGARQAMLATLDQAGGQAGNVASIESAKGLYNGLFDSLKYADVLALDLDAAAAGFHLSGVLTAKPGSDAAKAIAASQIGTGSELAQFAADNAYFIYMNMGADTIDRFMTMSLRVTSPAGKPSPELEQARAALREQGRVETVSGIGFDKGMTGVTLSHVADPKKFLEISKSIAQASKGGKDTASPIKEIKIESDVATYRGLTFSHIATTIDFDKLGAQGGANPAGIASIKALYNGGTMNTWYGIDGTRVLQVIAPTWNDAKAQIDTFLDGKASIGASPNFKALRAQLPEKNSLLAIVSIQGLVKMFASQFAAAANKPDLKPPGDLPKEPALFGFSLAPKPPAAYEFHFILPSQVGPVVEKGLVPLFQALPAPAAR